MNFIGSLPESLTQGLVIGKLLVGGLGVFVYLLFMFFFRSVYIFLSGEPQADNTSILVISYPFSQFCEIIISLLSLQKPPNTAPNLFQRGVEYGEYDKRISNERTIQNQGEGHTCSLYYLYILFYTISLPLSIHYMYVRTYVCMYVCMYYMCVYIYIYTYVCMYVCMYVGVYIYIYIYICTYLYI